MLTRCRPCLFCNLISPLLSKDLLRYTALFKCVEGRMFLVLAMKPVTRKPVPKEFE